MRQSLGMAALMAVLLLLSVSPSLVDASQSLRGGGGDSQQQQEEEEQLKVVGSTDLEEPMLSHSNTRATNDIVTEYKSIKEQQKQPPPSLLERATRRKVANTRRERKCDIEVQEECGGGMGHLLCEYDPDLDVYATRCVKQHKVQLHLQIHPRNSCGACKRCFESSAELREAVVRYIANNTAYTEVAKSYGWPINRWCVTNIEDFSYLFANQRKFREYIGDWDVSNARNMSGMFQGAFVYNQDISPWCTEHVEDMSKMFDCAYAFNQPLQLDTSRVKSMHKMFRVAKNFNSPDLRHWETSRVTDLSYMFYRAHSFDQPLEWDTSNVRDTSFMFAFTRLFNQSSVAHWDVSKVKTMRGMFQSTQSFTQDLSSWNVQSVQDMAFLFHHAQSFQEDHEKQKAIVQHWDLSHVRDKQAMLEFGSVALNMTGDMMMMDEGVMHPSYNSKTTVDDMVVPPEEEEEDTVTS